MVLRQEGRWDLSTSRTSSGSPLSRTQPHGPFAECFRTRSDAPMGLRATAAMRHPDDFTVIWRGLTIGRIMKRSGVPSRAEAHAFRVFQRSMYQIEIVRLCAMWDGVDPDKENIPTVVKLIDDAEIIEMLAEETRSHWASGAGATRWINPSNDPIIAAEMEREMREAIDLRFADEQASQARTELGQAIADAGAVLMSPQLASIMNIRDKHLAHSLETTRREKEGPVQPLKHGDGTVECVDPDYRTSLLLGKRQEFLD
jgi:AbiU2